MRVGEFVEGDQVRNQLGWDIIKIQTVTLHHGWRPSGHRHRAGSRHCVHRPWSAGARNRRRLMIMANLFKHLLQPFMKMRRIRKLWEFLMLLLGQHNQTAKQTPIYEGADVAPMIMERPCASHFIDNLECVCPGLAGTDFIRPATIAGLCAERPRSV